MKKPNYKLLILSLMGLSIGLVSCDDDPVDVDEFNTIRIELGPKFNNGTSEAVDNGIYSTNEGPEFKFTELKYFISNVELEAEDGSIETVKDIHLFQLSIDSTHVIEAVVKAQKYVKLRYGIGVDSVINNNVNNPGLWSSKHPLSVNNGMWWAWATRYRFVIMEGMVDTAGTGSNFDLPMIFHTGTEPLYRSIERNVSYDLSMSDVSDWHGPDIQQIFNHSGDPIDLAEDRSTHTTNNYALAERFTDNFAASLAF